MANVTVKGWGEERGKPVEYYVADSTASYSEGMAEIAQDQADNVAHTLGRLVEALVDKGILDRLDLQYIVGASAPTVIKLRRNNNVKKV